MAFELFTKTVSRSSDPHVTLNSFGRFSINTGATALLRQHFAAEYVLLYWDKTTREIAVQPIKKKEPSAYPLKTYGRALTGFSAVTFLNFIKYDWSETHTFPAEWRTTQNMLVFTIPQDYLMGKAVTRRNFSDIVRDRMKKGNY